MDGRVAAKSWFPMPELVVCASSDRGHPLDGHIFEPIALFADVPGRRKRRMKECELAPFGGCHIEHSASCHPRLVGVHIEDGRPVRMASEQARMVGEIH